MRSMKLKTGVQSTRAMSAINTMMMRLRGRRRAVFSTSQPGRLEARRTETGADDRNADDGDQRNRQEVGNIHVNHDFSCLSNPEEFRRADFLSRTCINVRGSIFLFNRNGTKRHYVLVTVFKEMETKLNRR